MKNAVLFPVSLLVSCSLFLASCVGTAPAVRGVKTTVGASTDIAFFDTKATMTVDDVTLDFFPENKKVLKDPKEDKKQFVRAGLTFKNNGDKPFKMNYTNITLDGAAEKGVMLTFLLNKSNVQDLLDSKELAKGESVSGAMYFEVPAEEKLETLSVSYKGYVDGESKEFKVPLKK